MKNDEAIPTSYGVYDVINSFYLGASWETVYSFHRLNTLEVLKKDGGRWAESALPPFARATIETLTETGNRARQTSGTQGTVNRIELRNRFWFTIAVAKICVTSCQTSTVRGPNISCLIPN